MIDVLKALRDGRKLRVKFWSSYAWLQLKDDEFKSSLGGDQNGPQILVALAYFINHPDEVEFYYAPNEPRPIEDAPKDEQVLLLKKYSEGKTVGMLSQSASQKAPGDFYTHWLPLPEIKWPEDGK